MCRWQLALCRHSPANIMTLVVSGKCWKIARRMLELNVRSSFRCPSGSNLSSNSSSRKHIFTCFPFCFSQCWGIFPLPAHLPTCIFPSSVYQFCIAFELRLAAEIALEGGHNEIESVSRLMWIWFAWNSWIESRGGIAALWLKINKPLPNKLGDTKISIGYG